MLSTEDHRLQSSRTDNEDLVKIVPLDTIFFTLVIPLAGYSRRSHCSPATKTKNSHKIRLGKPKISNKRDRYPSPKPLIYEQHPAHFSQMIRTRPDTRKSLHQLPRQRRFRLLTQNLIQGPRNPPSLQRARVGRICRRDRRQRLFSPATTICCFFFFFVCDMEQPRIMWVAKKMRRGKADRIYHGEDV